MTREESRGSGTTGIQQRLPLRRHIRGLLGRLRAMVERLPLSHGVRRQQQPPPLTSVPANEFIPLSELNIAVVRHIYTPLAEDEIRIVLVKAGGKDDPLECFVRNVSHETAGRHAALSYVWGSQDDPKKISLNCHEFFVTGNLYEALLHPRSESELRVFWIDALAINQADITERNSQVRKMASIYSSAYVVLIWLGAQEKRTEELLKLAHEDMEAFHKRLGSLASPNWPEDGVALMKIPSHPYWTRCWIWQEIHFAKHAFVIFGSSQLELTTLYTIWQWFQEESSKLTKSLPSGSRHEYVLALLPIFAMGFANLGKVPNPSPTGGRQDLTVEKWCKMYVDMQATDPRDLVFAYFGCFPEHLQAKIDLDYGREAAEVLEEMTRLVIEETKSLDVLFTPTPERISRQTGYWNVSKASWAIGGKIGEGGHLTGHVSFAYPIFAEFPAPTILHTKGFTLGTVGKVNLSFSEFLYPSDPNVGRFNSIPRWMVEKWSRAERLAKMDAYCEHSFRSFNMEFLEDEKQKLKSLFRSGKVTASSNVDVDAVQMGMHHSQSTRMFLVNGMCAFGDKAVASGDIVCVLLGASVLTILRPCGERAYRVVGAACAPNAWDSDGLRDVRATLIASGGDVSVVKSLLDDFILV